MQAESRMRGRTDLSSKTPRSPRIYEIKKCNGCNDNCYLNCDRPQLYHSQSFVSTIEPSSYVCTYICTLSFCASSRLRQLAQSSTSYIPPATASSQHRFDRAYGYWLIHWLPTRSWYSCPARMLLNFSFPTRTIVYRHDGRRVHTMWFSRSLGSTLALPFATTSTNDRSQSKDLHMLSWLP